jgi:hypothetical protein
MRMNALPAIPRMPCILFSPALETFPIEVIGRVK